MKTNVKFCIAISLLLILSTISFSAFAQKVDYKLTELQDKTWAMQGLTDKTNDNKFENNKISIYLNGEYIGAFEYYLSDSIETVFDSTKVGMVNQGKYIVERLIPNPQKTSATQTRRISVFEIIELSTTTLVLRNVKQEYLLEYKAK
jgi:hypothetical protein